MLLSINADSCKGDIAMRNIVNNKAENTFRVALILCAIFGQWAWAASGGPYELSWTTVDGGGGTSSGGQYTLSATIGQHDAAYSSSDDYELLGGFWPGGPLCIVDFEDFAKFAQYWLDTGTDLPADLYEDENDIVDVFDLKELVNEWLNYCPYDWPLK